MKSPHGNTCCQIYSHKSGFADCYSQLNVKGGSLGESLDSFVHDFVAPDHLMVDGFRSQASKNTRFFMNLHKYSINHHVSAPRQPNENPAEVTIRKLNVASTKLWRGRGYGN